MQELKNLNDNKIIALTFDDGPSIDTTPQILDKLEKYGVKATFFLCGKNINEESKMIMERQLELGCELQNHSWSHIDMSLINEKEISKEVLDTSRIIYKTVGVKPTFFRPPYILTSQTMFDLIELPFINGVACSDWEEDVSSEVRISTLLQNVTDGDIILLHDFSGNINTVNAMDGIITGLWERGFQFVTLSELFRLKGVDYNVKHKLWSNVLD